MKVIFLDIDGVLQPYNSSKRFNINRKKLVLDLLEKYKIDYTQYDEHDVAAAYCDRNKDGVNRIKKIIEETNAKIVISSNWRSKKTPNKTKDFLHFYDLDKYLIRQTDEYDEIKNNNIIDDNYHYRIIEILDYLKNNKEIKNYVVIDDMNLNKRLDNT